MGPEGAQRRKRNEVGGNGGGWKGRGEVGAVGNVCPRLLDIKPEQYAAGIHTLGKVIRHALKAAGAGRLAGLQH